jgi:hypothetical protein
MTPLVRIVASGSTAAKCLVSAVSATPALRAASAALEHRSLRPAPDAAYASLRLISDAGCLATAELGGCLSGRRPESQGENT